MAQDILNYGPTRQEQEIIALLRSIEYGEVTVKLQAGNVVLVEHKTTRKVTGHRPGEIIPACNYK